MTQTRRRQPTNKVRRKQLEGAEQGMNTAGFEPVWSSSKQMKSVRLPSSALLSLESCVKVEVEVAVFFLSFIVLYVHSQNHKAS